MSATPCSSAKFDAHPFTGGLLGEWVKYNLLFNLFFYSFLYALFENSATDATWCGGRPRPRPHSARWGPSSPSAKGVQSPIFGPCILWPNGWMDQDGTWHGSGP